MSFRCCGDKQLLEIRLLLTQFLRGKSLVWGDEEPALCCQSTCVWG